MKTAIHVDAGARTRPPDRKILVMAHRGCAARYPENTLLGFRKALELGVEIVEFDVRLSRDKVPVVIHDAKLDRTTDATGPVGDRTLAELKAVDAGVRKGEAFRGERIPTLAEVLDLMETHPSVILNVEIKERTEENADLTLAALAQRNMLPRCVFTCFDGRILRHLKERRPDIKVQGFPAPMMANFEEGEGGTFSFMDYVGIPLRDATKEMADGFRKRGIVPGVWCADDMEAIRRAVDTGVEIITSNAPDVLCATLEEWGLR
jgi:glycerophosphoryl diester phosphodiesterase